jgi:hypothetical protein
MKQFAYLMAPSADNCDVRFWSIADMPLAPKDVGFGGKADITVDGPECLLLTQSGHRMVP